MGLITHEMEMISPIPPAKMFQAFVLDADEIFPKVLPHIFKSVETIEGDGGPGTIKKMHFGEASEFKHATSKIDFLDKIKMTFGYSWIEGDALMNKFEKISYEFRFEAGPNGGSICKNTCKYYTTGDIQLTQEQLNEGKEKATGLFKAVEGYLLAAQ